MTMFQRILLAYDGSEPAQKAYGVAADLAHKYGAELFVLTVARPPEFAEDVETEAIIENSRDYHERLLVPLRERAAKDGLRARFEVAIGHPAEQIIYRPHSAQPHLILWGLRGRRCSRAFC